ncbi:hypothetical protein [Pararobbsia alpina]|uniref:Uncharacterized protein n=1 Tax=Pararobbsia alpina TaxID=621374 RepID=A0A6S7AXE6_9BURK|nr:hypothetical protein [Pararobbsia alpina]CAB3776259.1 hypothetical protein LMG28138_00114 [Pararobbsia alpina]
MKYLSINLCATPYRPAPFGMLFAGLGMLALAWALMAEARVSALEIQIEQQQRARRTQQRRQDTSIRKPAAPGKEGIVIAAQGHALMPSLLWLERTWNKNVIYERIEVDNTSRTQRIEIVAHDSETLYGLMDSLLKLPQISQVTLLRQQSANDAVQPTLQLQWRAGGR